MAKKRRRSNALRNVLIALILILIAAIGVLLWMCFQFPLDTAPAQTQPPTTQASETVPTTQPPTETTETTVPTEPPTEPPIQLVSRATILSTGDLLMHGQLIRDAQQSDGTYDFSYIFPYLSEYTATADFSVANLETTLAGTAKPYQGNPMFNCPDAIVDAAKDAGFDMLLTANNHSYDSQQAGFERTIQVVREKGLVNLGTMLSGDEPKYTVQDINGIKIGMIAYTYEDSQSGSTPPALNYNPMGSNGYDIINCFRQSDPEPFYRELETQLAMMKEDGAEATIVYLHWGQEYKLTPNATQQAIAQKLCDLGVDVIIGGHPHVVQPGALLTSTVDPNHKTVIIYSMGNAVSNQRLGKITSISTAHTEDGMLFYVTFSKYSDGAVYLESVSVTPTWVRAIDVNGNTVVRDSATITRYEILPLDISRESQWREIFGVDDATYQQLCDSYTRTMEVVGGPGGGGLGDAINYLTAEQIARETDYETATRPAA